MALLKDSLPDERDRHIPGKPGNGAAPIELGTDPLTVTELEDGGAEVVFGDEKPARPSGGFFENLADAIDETELQILARDLLDRVEADKLARQRRDAMYEEGLKRTGLGDDAPGGASFTGASRAVHPMITEACVDFHAAAMKELFPPSGPVKTEIFGEKTPEQLKLADRQYRYMNWQMTEQIEEYADELAVTMTQLPMGGSQYMKFWKDADERRTCCEFVPIDDLLVPYGCNSFWSAHRITHVMRLTESVFEARVESGMYRELPELEVAPSSPPETTKTQQASERIEGVEAPSENIDGIRLVYELNTFLRLDIEGGDRLPYLITIDERTSKVLAIYRNWEEEDKLQKRLHWIVDYNFIPWRGAQKMGIAQMIGGLSAAATGALRALLDSALVQTIPVLAKLKGAKFGGQSKTIDPMTITEVEAGTAVDDIRKVLMAMPFNQPSPVLYALLGWLSEQAKGVVTTAEEKIADASNQMPMGTALALMESGAKVYSSIHAGLHRSQKKALKIIARLNKEGVDEEGQIEKFGQVICSTEDFRQPLGVVPVSDPNIFSESQRYAQMQIVTGFALGMDPKTGQPTATARLHNMHAVLKRTYELAKIPNIDEILPPEKKPQELNAAAENSAVMLGAPIMAFPEQNHMAHLETHMRFIKDPFFGGSQAAIPSGWPGMVEHIKQHLSFLYAQEMHKLASQTLGADISEAMKDKQNWPQIDAVLAAASRLVHARMQKILEPLGPVMNEMIQKVESMKPPAPMDPSQAAITVAKMEDARKREETKGTGQLSAAELETKRKKDEADAAAAAEANRIKDKDVTGKLDLGRGKLELEAAGAGHEQALDIAGHRREGEAQQHAQKIAEGDQRLKQGDQSLKGQDQRLREATAADESRRAGEDHRLRAAEAADKSKIAAGDQHLAAGGQAHDQTMARAELERNLVADEHGRGMAEADLGQRQAEHKDTVSQQEKDRKAESARAKLDAKAKSKPKPKPKGAGK